MPRYATAARAMPSYMPSEGGQAKKKGEKAPCGWAKERVCGRADVHTAVAPCHNLFGDDLGLTFPRFQVHCVGYNVF